MDNLISTIKAHEGTTRFVVIDTRGFYTIATGRCVDSRCDHGLSDDEINLILSNDITRCRDELKDKPYFFYQDPIRKEVLIELVFNLGLEGLETFTTFLSYFSSHDYIKASDDLKNTKWAKEVHSTRVNNICYRIVNGKYP